MASITITYIEFSAEPATTQRVQVYYRVATDPDENSSYVLVTDSQDILPDGTLTPSPLVIDGLDEGTDYIVKIVPECGSAYFYKYFRTPPAHDFSCANPCCSWTITNDSTVSGDTLYLNTSSVLTTLTVAPGGTATFQGKQIISVPPGFTLSPSSTCSTTTTTTIAPVVNVTGQIKIMCTDDNCSHQGDTVFTVSLSRTFSFPITLLIGQIQDYGGPPITPTLRYPYMGYNIYQPPVGLGYYPHPYYDNPGAMGSAVPFKVIIPANTLNYTAPLYVVQDGINPTTTGWGRWVCEHCDWKIKDLYVKVNNPGYAANFSIAPSGHQYTYTTIHNV